MFWGIISKLVQKLVPSIGADPEEQYRWQQSVALALIAVIVAFVIHVLLSCGYARPLGYSGFARADDLSKVDASVSNLVVHQTEREILDDRGKECAAIKAGNQLARDFALGKLQDGLEDWRATHNGHDYRLPTCDEVAGGG